LRTGKCTRVEKRNRTSKETIEKEGAIEAREREEENDRRKAVLVVYIASKLVYLVFISLVRASGD
jgi:hypothetical protein